MSEEFDDIQEEPLDEEQNLDEEQPFEGEAQATGKFSRLLGSDSRKFKLSGMFKDWFLDYSSYVILQRAVPHIVDGLKPVQRRVLHAMYKMDDGRYTKVANIVGQAMQYHPHGDQSILGALVQLGQKGYAIDCQGNWGNILTGDSNAAPRYIEARLSKFAKEVIFDPKVTHWMTSYDGRNQEPTELPVRFPILLAQGTEGIAVGMQSRILPHNFNELIDASVAILKEEPYELYPDFPTGGLVDCSKYNHGRRGGQVKIRARIEKVDKSTVTITEIPYGKTSHMIIDSILKAKDKGKIKIKKIEDMTTDKVEIIIHLPADVSPDKTIDALYAFTDCETTVNPNACVIKEDKPQFLSVNDILEYDTMHTRDLLGQELEIKLGELEDQWHYDSLERIFFENRIYKVLEQDQRDWDEQLQDIFERMKQYQDLLHREITMDDILKLVEKPVRKISKFDTKALDEKIYALEDEMKDVRDKLEHLTQYTRPGGRDEGRAGQARAPDAVHHRVVPEPEEEVRQGSSAPDGDHFLRDHRRDQGREQQREAVREPRGRLRGHRPQELRGSRIHRRLLRPFGDHRHRQGRQVPGDQGGRQGLLREGSPLGRRVQPERRPHHLQRHLPRRQGPGPLRQAFRHHVHHARQGV